MGILKSIWFLFRHLSVVHSSFRYGKKLKFGYFNVIEKGCVVGDNVNIQNFVLLKSSTQIGSDVYVDSYVRSSGDNIIGSRVTLRFGSTIARKVFVDNDVFISPNVMTVYSLPDGSQSKGTYIMDGAFVGTAAVIGPNITINKKAIVGTNSFVNKDCEEGGVYAGVPAKKIR
jgi:acetyltransferase-like isoleucine patch superfamily enzyme